MKKISKILINLGFVLFLEILFYLLIFKKIQINTFFNIFTFSLLFSSVYTLITSIFSEKVNRLITYIILSILGIIFSVEFVYVKIFNCYFSWSLLGIADQPLKFAKTAITEIFKCSYGIVLFFAPLIISIIFRKKINYEKNNSKNNILNAIILIFSILSIVINTFVTKNNKYSMYELYFHVNEPSINIEKMGVINTNCIDIFRLIFDFNENIKNFSSNNEPKETKYENNSIDLDFEKIKSKTTNKNLIKIDEYMSNEKPTNKNMYTGFFENKNLIFIVAESFSNMSVDEKLTPTLYKLVNNGFTFNNFYTPNNASTIGGEFQALTGLYADNSILTKWRSGKNYFPYGLGTVFKEKGYSTYAYHNNSYTFQDRYKYLKSQGLDNFKACFNGLEKKINCHIWPESDIEMVNATMSDYINKDKFLAYYMTVSGHFEYSYNDNFIASKNKKYVKDLKYSEEAKAYLATQIELDKALESMINKLKQANKLDDTVIVLLADHYPYQLSLKAINEISSYKKDNIVGVNKSNLIIWNNKMDNVVVDKTAMSLDVLPTILNLFNIEYDSRLIVGKDILSDENGLAIMKNRSWVSDNGTYYSKDNKAIKNNENMTDEYIKNINTIVSNKMNISKLIIENDYYRHVFK